MSDPYFLLFLHDISSTSDMNHVLSLNYGGEMLSYYMMCLVEEVGRI